MDREGRQGYPGARPRSQMLPGRATEGFCSHHDMCYSTDTWVPRQLWLGAHLQFHNLPKFLPLFVKKSKKNEAGWGTERTLLTLSEAGRQLALSALAEGQPQLRQATKISLVSVSLARVRAIVKRLAGSKI